MDMFGVYFTGNLVSDPTMASTKEGKPVCNLLCAVNRGFRKRGEQNDAFFVKVAVWGNQGETCARFLKKGRRVAVSGRVTNIAGYVGKNGNPGYNFDVQGDEVDFMPDSGTRDEYAAAAEASEQRRAAASTAIPVDGQSGFIAVDPEDELPFDRFGERR